MGVRGELLENIAPVLLLLGLDAALARPVTLVGAPAGCAMKFQRPNDGTADAQKLGEQNFLSGDNSNFGAMFANKIRVECP